MAAQNGEQKLAAFVDVFCERGAFTTEQSSRILRAAVAARPQTRIHVCQLTPHGACAASPNSIPPASTTWTTSATPTSPGWRSTDTVATLLPAANYFLGLETLPAGPQAHRRRRRRRPGHRLQSRHLADASMPFVLSVACTHMKMSPAEAITAATINGACALNCNTGREASSPAKTPTSPSSTPTTTANFLTGSA